jgi:hypothetical protein
VLTAGSYQLESIALSSAVVQTLRVPRIQNTNGGIDEFIYIEYRLPLGYETFSPTSNVVNGLSLRLASGFDKVGRSFLLDTHPQTATYDDAPLMQGESFVDQSTGMSITLEKFDLSQAIVKVDPGTPTSCSSASPTASLQPTYTSPVKAGDTLSFDIEYTNSDSAGCPKVVTFIVSAINLPNGWSQGEAGQPLEAILKPGQQANTKVAVDIAQTALPGTYSFTIRIKNTKSTLVTDLKVSITI